MTITEAKSAARNHSTVHVFIEETGKTYLAAVASAREVTQMAEVVLSNGTHYVVPVANVHWRTSV